MSSYKIFKGTDSEYRTLHAWVERRLGKPMVCWECGSTDKKRYEWSNISGEYKRELSDWRRLCKSCHAKIDLVGEASRQYFRALTHCKWGHERTEENIYNHPSGGKACRTCKRDQDREALRRFRAKKKLEKAL